MFKEFNFIHVVTKGGHDRTEKRVPGIIICFVRELSLQKRAVSSGEYAGRALPLPPVWPGCQCNKRPCVPLAKRCSTARFAFSITLIKWGLGLGFFVSKLECQSPADVKRPDRGYVWSYDCLPVCLFVRLFVHLSVCLLVFQSVCVYVGLSVRTSESLCLSASVHPAVADHPLVSCGSLQMFRRSLDIDVVRAKIHLSAFSRCLLINAL